MYHVIDEPNSRAEARYCVSRYNFEVQMRYLVDSGHNLMGLSSLLEVLSAKQTIPENSIVITFDDGFSCFQRNALPTLNKFNIPATLFAVAGLLGKSNTWMQAAPPPRKLLSGNELRGLLAQRIEIGCHGLSHVPMTSTDNRGLVRETRDAKNILENAIGQTISLFAFPHGDQGERERQAVADAGFSAACSTNPGFIRHDADLFALRRIDVFGQDSLSHFKRKIRFGANIVTPVHLMRYYASRLLAR